MTHPQFMIDRRQIEDIRARMEGDAALRERVASLTSRRDVCMNEEFLTEEYANRVYSQHGNYYEIGAQLHRLASTLSACYVLYDDREAAACLRDAMLHVASFAVWTGPQNKDRDVPWLSDLSTTRIAVELAFGYDMIYDTLTEDERNTIARAILDKGVMPLLYDWVLPERRIHALDSMGHNWWSVCIGLAGAAMLPVSDYVEKDRFDELIAYIEQALIEFLNYPGCTLFNKVPNYDEQGLFYESVGYFCYGTGELLRYLWHAERYLGRRETLRAALPAGFAKAILSFAYPYTQDGKTNIGFLNYGDSAYTANIMPMVRWLRLLGYDTPALSSYASSVACEEDILSLTEPVDSAATVGLETLPKTAVYPQTGYAITRSDWRPDATLLAIKSGYTWNHAHADAGSFVLYDKGRPLLIDSGSCPYGDRLYRTYYCKDISHNVLLVDGEGQRDEEQIRGSKFPGSICDHYEKDGFLYVLADATGPMAHVCSRMYRSFLWLDGKTLVIIDDVLCHEPRTIQFLLHYDGEATTEANVVDIRGERSRACLHSLYPRAETIRKCVGYLASAYGSVKQDAATERDYLSLDGEERTRVHSLLHVITLGEEQDTQVERLEGRECIGVRLTQGDVVREIWYNLRADGRRMHINSNNTLGAWDTDAYILMTENSTMENKIFAVSASYVRNDSEVRYASFQKKTGYI